MIGNPIGYPIGGVLGNVSNVVSVVLDDCTLVATASLSITGVVSVQLDDVALVATGASLITSPYTRAKYITTAVPVGVVITTARSNASQITA